MPTKVFLHIGTNKTGTTALQRFFNQQREQLKKRDLLYPATACTGEAHYALSRALGFYHGKSGPLDVQGSELKTLNGALKREIENSGAQHVVLSSEMFIIPRAIEPVQEFLAPFDVRIVVYLRRHDDWWQSAYNQAVKTVETPPWGRGFAAYINFQKRKNPRYGRYRDLVDRWAKVFGRENVIVRPYERQQNQPDIVSDFLCAIGLNSLPSQIDTKTERTNEALSPLSLNLVDIFQRVNVDSGIRSKLIQHALSLPGDGRRLSIVPPAFRRRLVDENLADYEYIAKEFLLREDGRLFYDALPDPDEIWEEPKHPTFMEAVEETVNALVKNDAVLAKVFSGLKKVK